MNSKNIMIILFSFILVLSISILAYLDTSRNLIAQDTIRIQYETEQIKQKTEKLTEYHQALQSLTGFFINADSRNSLKSMMDVSVDTDQLVKELETASKDYSDPSSQSYLGLTNLIKDDSESDIKDNNSGSKPSFVNIEKVLQACISRIYVLQNNNASLEDFIKNEKQKAKQKNILKETILQKKNETLKALKDEYEQLSSRYNEQLDNIKEQQRKAEDERDKDVQIKGSLEEKLAQKKSEYESIISQKKNEILKIQAEKYGRTAYSEVNKQKTFQPEEEKEDGTVIYTDPLSQSVYIDLGKECNIIPGLKFDVYRNAKQGNKKFIGRIEVQKIQDKISTATIIEIVDPLDPIVDGDLLSNPMYRKDKPVYVAFAGTLHNVTNEEATKFIEKVGAKVEKRVNAKTNYVIVGYQVEDNLNYRDAAKFGIPLMTEQVLFQYIGY
jgi:NAD-dependent DNA ligase